MIRIYGTARSRASRSLVAAEEVGARYEHVPLIPEPNSRDRVTLLRLNPNAKIPVLEEGDFVIWESMAINLYLGERFGGPLWPTGLEARAKLYQWSLWAQTSHDVEARLRARRGGDPDLKAKAQTERMAALAVLEGALQGRSYLLGETFTLADLNVATTLSEPHENGLIDGDLNPFAHDLPALADWLERCTGRASWGKVRSLP
ncbi:MAG: glutathione S-transferase family protein [Caulobacteraceae bacterium]